LLPFLFLGLGTSLLPPFFFFDLPLDGKFNVFNACLKRLSSLPYSTEYKSFSNSFPSFV